VKNTKGGVTTKGEGKKTRVPSLGKKGRDDYRQKLIWPGEKRKLIREVKAPHPHL